MFCCVYLIFYEVLIGDVLQFLCVIGAIVIKSNSWFWKVMLCGFYIWWLL